MKKIIMASVALLALAACSSDKGQEMADMPETAPAEQQAVVFNIVGQTFYNEFIPCTGGPDYSREAAAEMVAEWRNLGISSDILGAWGYEPASENNQYENGWWELQWTDKEAADKGWQEWMANEGAQAWSEKYASVMTCDGPNRVSWDFHFARDPYSFGELNASGEFFSAYLPCNLNEGKTMADADAAIELYNVWLDNLDAEQVSFYAYGIYASNAGSTEVDLYWGNFHESAEAMQAGDEMWATTGGDAKAAVEAAMTCGNPELHNSKLLYDPANPDFS
jgi:hypothetical protein